MARELRATLAIMVIVLIVFAPAIFAEPSLQTKSYLAMVFNDLPTSIPLPTVTPMPTPIPVTLLTNGDFEQGATYWQPQDSADAFIIANPSAPVTPHSGTRLLRLAPDAFGFAAAIDAVNVTVPADTPVLSYWAWVRSTESDCFSDVGGAGVAPHTLDTIFLCATTQTNGWVRHTLNLASRAGQSITIEFSAGSYTADVPGVTHNSVLYIDDVGWRAAP